MHGALMKDKVYDRMSADLPINAVVAPAVVDDPIEHGAKLKVLRSLRDDPLASMHSRGHIDDAQMAAGRLWQRYREHSEVGGARAIDPTKEAVDGGRFKEPDITRQSRALAELKRADAMFKKAHDDMAPSLIYDVLARNMSITEIAQARSITSGRQICYLMERFRGALDDLAKLWGLAG
jgi:hypothetical protein